MDGKNFSLTVYHANQRGSPQNCLYPHERTADTAESLKPLLSYDHVFIRFAGNYRSKDHFVQATTAVFDCDNDHTDDSSDWVRPEDIPVLFSNVRSIVYTSRSHMKWKGSRSERPRFHVIFFIDAITDPDAYTAFMRKVQSLYPFFDKNALDAARFFYGNPDTEVWFFSGNLSLTAFFADEESAQAFAELGETIPEGSRNSTLSVAAGKILKRWGDTPEAYQRYLDLAEKCVPPLEEEELDRIWQSARRFYHNKVVTAPGYEDPATYNSPSPVKWETPIPFAQAILPAFPVEALPPTVRDYVLAVAESTQTPVDMSASAALAILALCEQGKYRIRGKADWTEPLNLFVVIVAEPSERKSAVISFMTKPLNTFEAEYNRQNAAELEASKMNKRILERRQRALEDKAAKGKVEDGELEQLARQIATYKEKTPLRLYVDDVTTEKLTSVLAEGGGKAAIVSAEGGIFDMLSGIYTKNVNIDVMLKGHSGDSIRVDRIGRNSESIMNPALTVLLTVQPNVLSGMMQNGTFRGRGLTARFLYCMPTSIVGQRKYRTEPIPAEISVKYAKLIQNLLEDEQPGEPEKITLSPEADLLLESFSGEVESKLKTEYADIADWAGKLVGAVLRIAGVLCRASVIRCNGLLEVPDPLVVDEATMRNAIAIGRYFTEHSRAAFSLLGADALVKQSQYLLDAICRKGLVEFTRRDIMRLCRSFKTADEVQPVLNHLAEYGYIAPMDSNVPSVKGRPAGQTYLVNPCLYGKAS